MGKKRKKRDQGWPSIKEAEKKERSLRADIDRGEATFADKITVEKYLKQWLDTVVKPGTRNSTYNNYLVQVNNISKTIGKIELTKLRDPQIQAHYNRELRRKLKPTSVRLQHSVLKMALEKAVEWQLISKNPCKYTEPPQKNKPKNADTLLRTSKSCWRYPKDTEMERPVPWGFYAACGRGGICGARWSDGSPTITMRGSGTAWTEWKGRGRTTERKRRGCLVWADSTRKARCLPWASKKPKKRQRHPLPAVVVHTLRRELERQETIKVIWICL